MISEREVIDKITELIEESNGATKKDDTNLSDAVSHLIDGYAESENDPVEVRKQTRDENWPYVPLLDEMTDETSGYYEPYDCIYLLYDAVPKLDIRFNISNGVTVTAQRFKNTTKIGESLYSVTNSLVDLHYTGGTDSTFNYVLLICRGTASINISNLNLYVNATDTSGNLLYQNINSDLLEVSGSCHGNCTYSIATSSVRFQPTSKLSYFSFDKLNIVDCGYMFYECRNLISVPYLDTKAPINNAAYMFYGCRKLKAFPLINTASATNMNYMFYYCQSLETIPHLDTGSATYMNYMFNYCVSLKTIPLLNTSAVTSMNNMFANCNSLNSIPEIDTHSVSSMSYMFSNCNTLTGIPMLDTRAVINMSYMFQYCYSLTSVPTLSTSIVTNMSYMFYGCSSLKRISIDPRAATNMSYMFQACTSLSAVYFIYSSNKASSMQYMFYGCTALKGVPALYTNYASNMSYMFGSCSQLEAVSLTYYNVSSAANAASMFANCYRLKQIRITNFGASGKVFGTNMFSGCYPLYGTNTVYHNTSSKDGFIYVNQTVASELRSTSGWSTFASQIVGSSV